MEALHNENENSDMEWKGIMEDSDKGSDLEFDDAEDEPEEENEYGIDSAFDEQGNRDIPTEVVTPFLDIWRDGNGRLQDGLRGFENQGSDNEQALL